MGLLDNIGGGNGLLPFAGRWNDATSSLAGLPPWAGDTLAAIQAGGSPYTPRFFSGGNMPAQSPTNAQGSGILPNAQEPPPAEAMAQTAPGGPQQGGMWGNILSGISNGIAAHPQTLMAMAGGFGQPGWGFGNAMRAAGPAMQHDQQLQLQMQGQTATEQALMKIPGMLPGLARAAALNPEILKTIAPELYQKPTWGVISEDPLGKHYGWIDPNKRTTTEGGGGGSVGMSLLAPGVKGLDPNASGDAYLNQFGPEIQAIVKAHLNGDQMPTGNPRTQGMIPFAKTVATKYASDMGIPFSDSIYAEKRKFRNELGSTTTGAGGQVKSLAQGIEHATDLASTLKQLGNWNGLGIPILASGANTARQFLSNEQSGLAQKAASIGQTLAGEVGKLFSGSAGGGVHERELTRERFSTVKSTPELAAALEATLDMMEGGQRAIEGRRDTLFGPNSSQDPTLQIISPQTREKINQLRQVIEELRSGKSSAPSAAPSAIPNGWNVTVR